MEKLPKSVISAIKTYYLNRKGPGKWDKQKDLDRLSEECTRHGVGLTAIAGMFCLHKRCIRWKVTEENIDRGGLRWVERDKGSLDWKFGEPG